jgi:hypothetical protein
MKTFTMTVGEEAAKFEVPETFTLSNLIDFMVNAGCKITPAVTPTVDLPEEEPKVEPWEDLGLTYMEWFRMYVSSW